MNKTRLDELNQVELPFCQQLAGMGWQHYTGDIDVPELTERQSFRETVLADRLRAALPAVNVDDETGEVWLTNDQAERAVYQLQQLAGARLMEANQEATSMLLRGIPAEPTEAQERAGRTPTVKFIDFEHPERNDYLVINQFRVDIPGGPHFIVPDIVLFVNGIPLVIVECKSPNITDPMEAGLKQLLRYSNQRDWIDEDEGVEKLFHYAQLLISTFFYRARVGTIGAQFEHYLEWKDAYPAAESEIAAELGVEKPSSQQRLVAGMLYPERLLDIVRNFTVFHEADGRTVKIVPRYQQYRAVLKAIEGLEHGQTLAQHGEADQRGGVIWHTQGSGKSLTMVFLVRKMRTLPALRRFKIVVVTDRNDLEDQLEGTSQLTGDLVRRAADADELQKLLAREGAGFIFGMIQKFRHEETADFDGESADTDADAALPPELNNSHEILVLIDEAHRSHSNTLHANLLRALPNCARIGFTGTPIMRADKKQTLDIFGRFIDVYTLRESEADEATVPILYEGKTADAIVAEDEVGLDRLFEDMFRDRSPQELEAIRQKYATRGNVLEAEKLIAAKAEDMLWHYVDKILPDGFKAQLVAVSRLAAVRYQKALDAARDDLVRRLEALSPAEVTTTTASVEAGEEPVDGIPAFLARAYPRLDLIKKLEFSAVISHDSDDAPSWAEWSNKAKRDSRIERFKKPLKDDQLAFLCVKSMLLTGFDAPVEQVMYLDRSMRDHELLQAIARVNRTRSGKDYGLVVDYFGVAKNLKKALAAYDEDDVRGALVNLQDELPKLAARHQRAIAIFTDRKLEIADTQSCVDLLADTKIRAAFVVALKEFMTSLEIVLPRPQALRFVKDAKVLGWINGSAANLYRDDNLNIAGAKHKVRALIDEHIISLGVDPAIGPISILDADFEKTVERHTSDRAKASEMEHALRAHVRARLAEDPVYFSKLSERLEAILEGLKDNWAQLILQLRELTDEVRAGRPEDGSGLDPRTEVPFLSLLVAADGDGSITNDELLRRAELTKQLVSLIKSEIVKVDFWRNAYARTRLRGEVEKFLDDHDLVAVPQQPVVADEVVEVAKALHARLTT
jgi:type I restriction enzyme R subunit